MASGEEDQQVLSPCKKSISTDNTMQQFAGVFQSSMADMTSSLLKLFEEQNKQQTAKFDKLVDSVGAHTGYPASSYPPSKRRTHDPRYRDEPPRSRFRFDEDHVYYDEASPHARYLAPGCCRNPTLVSPF